MALVGNLKDLKLPNIIQLNCMEKNTSKLTIESAGKFGFIYFKGGQIAHAEFDPDVGEKALFRMLALGEGKFKVEAGVLPPMVSIETHWNNLLLEGLHQLDTLKLTQEGKHAHLLDMLMNVKGVQKAAIINAEGDVVHSNYDAENESALHALTNFEIAKLSDLLGMSEPEFISIIETKKRILITKHKAGIIHIEIEAKHQLETVLPLIKQALT